MTKVNRVGERRKATNGQWMEIVKWNNSFDITVKFNDGTIREHVRYNHFLSGKVNPIHRTQRSETKKQNRIGERHLMKCGDYCEIIEYINSHNITVKFDDGTVLYKKYYVDFKNGLIKNPNHKTNPESHPRFKNRTGEAGILKNGQEIIIKDYRGRNDLDIQLKNGEILYNKSYDYFKRIQKTNQNHKGNRIKFKNRIGEQAKANNGQWMKIIDYNGYNDVTIQFEDGKIVYNKRYDAFKRGNIANPNCKIASGISCNEFVVYYYLRKYGFIKKKQGSLKDLGFGQMELDCYHPDYKIVIEYDGEFHAFRRNTDIKKNKACKQNGITIIRIREPKCPILNDNSIEYRIDSNERFSSSFEAVLKEIFKYIKSITGLNIDENISFEQDEDIILKEFNNAYINKYAKLRIGETNIASNGQKMTIIAYRSSIDIDIRFEDGTIVTNKTYSAFIKGQVPHDFKDRIGETIRANNNQKMTIIRWRKHIDIDVQFEDGTVVTNKRYDHFKTGDIKNPNCKKQHSYNFIDRTGEENIASNGQKMKIIVYREYRDIDVQFEDGTIVYHKNYRCFQKGNIANPNFKKVA